MLTNCHNRRDQVRNLDISKDDCENDNCTSKLFAQTEKKQLKDHFVFFDSYCYVLPVFGFISAKKTSIQSNLCLLPVFVKERYIDPSVITKTNQPTSFNFGDFQLFDVKNYLAEH